jgi:hypothetical protein
MVNEEVPPIPDLGTLTTARVVRPSRHSLQACKTRPASPAVGRFRRPRTAAPRPATDRSAANDPRAGREELIGPDRAETIAVVLTHQQPPAPHRMTL